MSENPNTNCLEGWQCHKCKSYGPFRIAAVIRAVIMMTDDGTIDESVRDTQWEDDAWSQCCECDHEATADYFSTPRTVLDDIVDAVN